MSGRTMSLQGFLILAVALAPLHAAVAEDLAALVQRLGDASFQVREQALRELLKIGPAARTAVEQGLATGDAEIRLRCTRLLQAYDELELGTLLDKLARDDVQPRDLNLPGWKAYEHRAGDSRPARLLYAQMLREELSLLRRIDGDPQVLSTALSNRCYAVARSLSGSGGPQRSASLGTLAALYFASSLPEVQIGEASLRYLVHSFAYQPALEQALGDSVWQEPARHILGHWIQRYAPAVDPTPLVRLALQYGVPQGVVAGLAVLSKPAAAPQEVQQAMLAIARFGSRDMAPALAAFLDDDRICSAQVLQNVRYTVEVRDVALAALIHLHGGDPADYGFPSVQKYASTVFYAASLGFETDAQRAAAHNRWRQAQPALQPPRAPPQSN
jgi:hypothetical protein